MPSMFLNVAVVDLGCGTREYLDSHSRIEDASKAGTECKLSENVQMKLERAYFAEITRVTFVCQY